MVEGGNESYWELETGSCTGAIWYILCFFDVKIPGLDKSQRSDLTAHCDSSSWLPLGLKEKLKAAVKIFAENFVALSTKFLASPLVTITLFFAHNPKMLYNQLIWRFLVLNFRKADYDIRYFLYFPSSNS